MSAMNCDITSFSGESDPVPVVSLNFDGRLFNEEAALETKCNILLHPNNRDPPVIVASNKAQVYEGNVSQTVCKNYLLIRNRKTGQASLYPYSTSRLANRLNKTSTNASSHASDSTMEKIVATFGSKKQKRQFALTHKLRTTKTSDVPSMNHSLVELNESMDVISKADNTGLNILSELLPSCDRNADSAEDVYSIANLLTEAELNELKGPAQLFLTQPPKEQSRSEFIVYDFFQSIGAEITLQQIQLLLYANSLLLFIRLPPSIANARNAASIICPHSKKTGSKIISNFTAAVGQKRSRTPKLTDKAICHAMVAILLACGLKLNKEWFLACLTGCKLQKFVSLMTIVGLSMLDKDYHILKLPLPPLPSIRTKKKRKD